MNKVRTILAILAIIFILGFLFNYSYAISITTVLDGGESFIAEGKNNKNKIGTLDNDNFTKNMKSIYKIVTTIGIGVSVIVSAILGIRIMLASAEEKAEVKENLLPYIIGCVVTFGAFSIWSIVMTIAGQIS